MQTSSRTLTSGEAAAAAGLSYRQLDYLVRTEIIAPSQHVVLPEGGPGTRQWAPSQLRMLRLIGVLRDHGAGYDTLRPAMKAAEALSEQAWSARVLITVDGRITSLLGDEPHGYVVDLAALRHEVPTAA